MNWGPHIVDPAVLLAGGQVKSAYGWMKQVNDPGDVEDVFFAVLTMTDGTVVHAEHSISSRGLPSWYVQGNRGTIIAEGRGVTVYAGEPPRPTDPTDYAARRAGKPHLTRETLAPAVYGDEHQTYREVAMSLRGERDFPVAPQDALELTRVLDAIRLSARENTVVALR